MVKSLILFINFSTKTAYLTQRESLYIFATKPLLKRSPFQGSFLEEDPTHAQGYQSALAIAKLHLYIPIPDGLEPFDLLPLKLRLEDMTKNGDINEVYSHRPAY